MSQTDKQKSEASCLAEVPRGKRSRRKAKFEVYGEEMIEKQVRPSGASGRIYLPPEWVGKNVKVIRL